MRRKRILGSVGDKVYYSHWYPANNWIVIWCRSKHRLFHPYKIGVFYLKKWSFKFDLKAWREKHFNRLSKEEDKGSGSAS